jgi:very-short-patch-repair endonuclease
MKSKYVKTFNCNDVIGIEEREEIQNMSEMELFKKSLDISGKYYSTLIPLAENKVLLRKIHKLLRESYPPEYLRWDIERFERGIIKEYKTIIPSMNEIEAGFYQFIYPLKVIPQFTISHYRVDFAIPKYKIAIEIDGHEWHSTKSQKARDAKRDRFLLSDGWITVRFTGSEIYNTPDVCKEEIKKIMKKRREELNGKN